MDGNRSDKPLAGKRIVVTRAGAQARELVKQIESLGGEVFEFPTIEIQPPESFAALDAAVEKVEDYHWLIFTSVNGVGPFLSRLRQAGKTAASLQGLKVGAIGPETAKTLESAGISACLMPQRYLAEGILDLVTPAAMKGQRVLIPRAAEAREVLPETLRSWGAVVDVVIAYRTALPNVDAAPLVELLRQRRVDIITFTSSSTVKNFLRLLGMNSFSEFAAETLLACIGPITSQTIAQTGGHAAIVAQEFTTAGLTRAIVEYFRSNSESPAASGVMREI